MSSDLMAHQSRIERYKVFESLSAKVNSTELNQACDEFVKEFNEDPVCLTKTISDLSATDEALRYGSCNLLGRLLDQPTQKRLILTSSQCEDMIKAMVLWLSNARSSKEATLILWSLKRDALLAREEIGQHVKVILKACQRAASDIKSESASRPSYAVAVAILQLISRLYATRKEIMQENTMIWFPLTLSYCCHGVSRLLRTSSQEVIELSHEHLLRNSSSVRSAVMDVSENIVANITNVLHKQYDEPCKLFAIKLWGILVIIMGEDMENVHTTNLYLSAMIKAFSKNYPSRQTAAFQAWKNLIKNLSTEYLLQPAVRKRLIIPLTKSNRVEESDCLVSRVDCWWTLIRRLGADITEHFTEICCPLLEFCLPQDRVPNKTGLKLASKVKIATVQVNQLDRECIAITLQYLGQHGTKVVDCIQLGYDQRRLCMTHPIVQHCGKFLLQAVRHSFNYILSMDAGEERQGLTSSLLRAYAVLVKAIVEHSSEIKNEDIVRTLARQVFSLILVSQLAGTKILDLVSPALDFHNKILSSTAYTPPDVNSFVLTPALHMLRKMWRTSSQLTEADDTERFCNCVCKLIERGSHSNTVDYVSNVVKDFPNRCRVELILRPLFTIAYMINKAVVNEHDISVLQSYLETCRNMVGNCPAEKCGQLIISLSDGLNVMFSRWTNAVSDKLRQFWLVVLDVMDNNKLSGEVTNGLVPTLLSVQSECSVDGTVETWRELVANHGKLDGEFSLMLAELEKCLNPNESPDITTLPPTLDSKKTSKQVNRSPTKKRLVVHSPSRSPLRSVNKKQLVLQDSPVVSRKPVKMKRGTDLIGEKSESLDLLNGLLTPEKRRKLAERTPERSLPTPRRVPDTKMGPACSPIKITSGKVKSSTKNSFRSSPEDEDCCAEELATPLIQCSQSIENSPEQSQRISLYDEEVSSQEITEQAVSSVKISFTTPKHRTKLHTFIAQTPGAPVVSPLPDVTSEQSASMIESLTPIKFSPDGKPDIELPRCSVKIRREVFDSKKLRSVVKVKEHGSTPKTPKTRPRKKKDNSQTDSQSSQSQSSQSSVDRSQTTKSKKKIVEYTAATIEWAPIVDRRFSCKTHAVMVNNRSVYVVECVRVKVIKSMKSTVKRAEDVFCLSQESNASADLPHNTDGQAAHTTIHEQMFDSISTHDSFFELQETPLPHDVILAGSPTPDAGSLEFISGVISASPLPDVIVSSANSQDTTPIPPRLVSTENTVTFSSRGDAVTSSSGDENIATASSAEADTNCVKHIPNTAIEDSIIDIESDESSLLVATQSNETNASVQCEDTHVTPIGATVASIDIGETETTKEVSSGKPSDQKTISRIHPLCQDSMTSIIEVSSSQCTELYPANIKVANKSLEEAALQSCVVVEQLSQCGEDVQTPNPDATECAEDMTMMEDCKKTDDDTLNENNSPAQKIAISSLAHESPEKISDVVTDSHHPSDSSAVDGKTDSLERECLGLEDTADNGITMSQFDEEMEIPVTDSGVDTCSELKLAATAEDVSNSSGSNSNLQSTVTSKSMPEITNEENDSTSNNDAGVLATPCRDVPALKNNKGSTSSPSRAQLILSRSSQILAMSTKNASSSPVGMNHVETIPVTPRSSMLNREARELDCTPIHSPTTGSILKRKHRGSPLGSSSKKVKFRLPEASSLTTQTGSIKKLQKKTDDGDILDMYSDFTESSVAKPVDREPGQSQVTSQSSQDSPIAAEYTESTLSIDQIVRHLNRPTWHGNLKQCLISQGVTTVGALAKLTEADIDLLPIAAPKLSTALKAFKKSGANKNPPKHKVADSASKLTPHQLERIMKLVTDSELSDSQLGSQIRSLFAPGDPQTDSTESVE